MEKATEISNKEIARALRLTAELLEVNDDNPFKARSLQNAAFKIERLSSALSTLSETEIAAIEGIGKSIREKITEYLEHGSFAELDQLLKTTPEGVVKMLQIKGIGPKKVRVLWKELGLESPGELLYACNENRLIELKGFGIKTQDLIKKSIEFSNSNEHKFLFAAAETVAKQLEKDFYQSGLLAEFSFTGALRRKCEILEAIEFLISTDYREKFIAFCRSHPLLESSEIKISGNILEAKVAARLPLNIRFCEKQSFGAELFVDTGSEEHLKVLREKYNWILDTTGDTEKKIYQKLNLPYIEPELREGMFEFDLAKNNQIPELLHMDDLKGILHNHTTYSDGEHSLEEMAAYCMNSGYQYLGICDHSKSAFYANGLQVDRIIKQHEEIDKLNKKMFPFRIFKGIESDILSDGSLDYPDEVLASFEFIVASVHSILKMDKEKATARLIRAIENPYTTILGHPSGRLLLAREGYPLDYEKIIDACSANGVIIELNANPYRLDIDWRYIPYALKKNVKISINPDAHRKEGYQDMYYGVCVARKGGLMKEMTFNALGLSEIEKYFLERKK